MNLQVYLFSELTQYQVYAMLCLRERVFQIEQGCKYCDTDGIDLRALHVLCTEKEQLVAYARLFLESESQDVVRMGRVVTDARFRGRHYGYAVVQEALRNAYKLTNTLKRVEIDAQAYTTGFYEKFGFVAYSDVFMEAETPHIKMKLEMS